MTKVMDAQKQLHDVIPRLYACVLEELVYSGKFLIGRQVE